MYPQGTGRIQPIPGTRLSAVPCSLLDMVTFIAWGAARARTGKLVSGALKAAGITA